MNARDTRSGVQTGHLAFRTPPSFRFWHTVYSHGWCALPPFSYDPERKCLERIFRLQGGALVHCSLTGRRREIAVSTVCREVLTETRRNDLVSQIRSCLRLDEDFHPFHREAARNPRFRWIATVGAGRLLRAPTVFEDVIKMICTTNCSWQLTTLMVSNLVRASGTPFRNGAHAFPTPDQVAVLSERTMRHQVKAGYRAPYLLEFARSVSSGKLDVEWWRTSSLPTAELYRRMLMIRGIGPYAAGNLLKLVGRYDELGLDSWVRKKFSELHGHGRMLKDKAIQRHYEPFGPWRGLFFWMEMTRDWHEQKFTL